jgi:glycosyltransferase involved in cell wall biosynthesis
MDVSLIIPAHDEECRLIATLDLYDGALAAHSGAYEILVIANGCTDGTAQVARDYARARPQIKVLEIPEKIGKGGAVLAGFQWAAGKRVAFADADGSTAPQSLLELLAWLDDYDVVIGSRRMAASVIERRQPLMRRLFGTAFAIAVRALFGTPYHDTQCGAKAFRRDAALLLSRAVQERRWAFDVDLLLASALLKLTIIEHPVVWADSPGSRLRIAPTLREVTSAFWRLKRRYAGGSLSPLSASVHAQAAEFGDVTVPSPALGD